MKYAKESNRYIQLTQQGLMRISDARRKSRKTLEEIALDRDTPSINTVKRLFKRQPVFLDTMERVWEFFQSCAHERKESFSYPIQGEDYLYVESEPRNALLLPEKKREEIDTGILKGWVSRQVPRQNRLFTGRREVLASLHASLQSGLSKNAPDPHALAGLGGVGKTQTALAYAYERRQDYNGVFWIRAESVEELNEGLAELAEELQLMQTDASKSEAIRKTHEWFQKSSNWLLVLDNADDIPTLAPYFPKHHSGALLLTTRSRNTVQWAAPIEIVKLERESGATLLLRRAGLLARNQNLQEASPDSVRIALAISDELDGLPLALDQAGAYISETEIDLEEYLSRYRKYGISLLDEVIDEDHASVRVTFGLALAQLSKRGTYGKAAKQLVQLSAFLAPDAIPEAIFASCPLIINSELTSTDLSDDLNAVYATACAFSLMSRVSLSKTLSIHRLAQAVVRESMTPAEQKNFKEHSVLAVSAATPDFEFEDWQLCDLLLPNWRVCAKYISELKLATKETVYLLFQAGRYLRTRALYEDAEFFLRRSLELSEIVHGSSHMTTADCADALACLYRELDRCDFAEGLHDQAIRITEAAGGPDHPELASKLHNAALLYVEKKEYLRAEVAFLRVLEIREKHPQEALLLAASLNQLGGVYRYQALFAQAEPFYKRALELYENALHPNHIDLAIGCSNLGYLFLNQGRIEEAETLLMRSLKINNDARGENHPETATVVSGIAILRWKQARFKESRDLFLQALSVYKKSFGEGHARYAKLLGQYYDFQKDADLIGK